MSQPQPDARFNSKQEAEQQPEHGLLRDLVHATYWLDDGLQAYMREHAGLSLPRAQSMMMVYLSEGVDRPADLAARLRVSKQAVQQGLKELTGKDMVTIEPDPDNGRQKDRTVYRARPGTTGHCARRAGEHSSHADGAHRRRSGAALRSALESDWGTAPGDP